MWRNPPSVDGVHSPLPVDQPIEPTATSEGFAGAVVASGDTPAPPGLASETVLSGPVSAPDLVGMSSSDARRVARLAGLHVDTQERPARDDRWGQVLSQDPQSGIEVVPGDTISIVVGGRPHVVIPDLRGRDESEAMADLHALGLAPERRGTRRSDKVPEGHVLRTWPRSDTEVAIGSRVAYVVAVGPRVKAGRARRERQRTRDGFVPNGSFMSLPEE